MRAGATLMVWVALSGCAGSGWQVEGPRPEGSAVSLARIAPFDAVERERATGDEDHHHDPRRRNEPGYVPSGGKGWTAEPEEDTRVRRPLRFSDDGYDLDRIDDGHCPGWVPYPRFRVDWRPAREWSHGSRLRKDPWSLKREVRLPPKPKKPSPPKLDERGRPTGSLRHVR